MTQVPVFSSDFDVRGSPRIHRERSTSSWQAQPTRRGGEPAFGGGREAAAQARPSGWRQERLPMALSVQRSPAPVP
jgi:hypothetical protein